MNDKYILDTNGNPVLELDLLKWACWYEKADRRIALTEIGDIHISTVFLGLDHNFEWIFGDGEYKPILYETMIFWPGHELDNDQARYSTREEALAGHEAVVTRVKIALKK